MPASDVLIVGAGIAGLGAAIGLARAGLRVCLVEAGPAPGAPGDASGLNDWDHRVSALTPASTGLLDQYGAWPAMVAARVGPYTDMRVWDAEGTGCIAFSAAALGEPLLGHIVENRVTVAALHAVARAQRGLELRYGATVDRLEAKRGALPTLVLDTGERLQGSLLVGADGARSITRKMLGMATRQWRYGQHAVVATVALADGHANTCYQAFLPTGPLALLPLAAPNLASIVWSLDDAALDARESLAPEAFCAALNRALHGRGPEVTGVSARHSFPLVQCHAIDYTAHRAVLVADAAHSIHPLAGQGINLGLADVAVLVEEVGRAWRDGLDIGGAAVLGRYQRRRKTENLAMMAAMEVFKRGFGSAEPLVRLARNLGLNWVDQMPPLKHWLARQALGDHQQA